MDATVNFWMPITNTITLTVTDTATDTNTKTKTKQYLYQSNRHGRGSRKEERFWGRGFCVRRRWTSSLGSHIYYFFYFLFFPYNGTNADLARCLLIVQSKAFSLGRRWQKSLIFDGCGATHHLSPHQSAALTASPQGEAFGTKFETVREIGIWRIILNYQFLILNSQLSGWAFPGY